MAEDPRVRTIRCRATFEAEDGPDGELPTKDEALHLIRHQFVVYETELEYEDGSTEEVRGG